MTSRVIERKTLVVKRHLNWLNVTLAVIDSNRLTVKLSSDNTRLRHDVYMYVWTRIDRRIN